MSSCGKCKNQIKRDSKEKIGCKKCRVYFHFSCINIKKEEIGLQQHWVCPLCVEEKSVSKTSGSSAPSDDDDEIKTNETSVKSMIVALSKSMEANFKKMEGEINISLNSCHQKLDDNTAMLNIQQKLLEDQKELIISLQTENKRIKDELREVKNRCDNLEQEMRSSSLEIHGIEKKDGENIEEIVTNIAKALDVKIDTTMIQNCFRVKTNALNQASPIMVNFMKKDYRNELLKNRRIKVNFSTRHIEGFNTDVPVYINESLTPLRRKLLAIARKNRSNLNWKYVWVRSGKIFCRKTDTSKIECIMTTEDIKRVFGTLEI